MKLTTTWEAIIKATGYSWEDVRGFARDEGINLERKVTLLSKKNLAKIILCNYAIREGYFTHWFEAKEEYISFCQSLQNPDTIQPTLWVEWLKLL